ncbi:MAG: hypothetical protein ACK53Y_01100, partial [bacterium]
FGVKRTTQAATAVLAGVYESNHILPEAVNHVLQQLQMSSNVRSLGTLSMQLTLEGYRAYWKKAKETTSCSPGPLSFVTMKAGASNDMISAIDCLLTRIPLKSGYTPSRWHSFMDVMILKKLATHIQEG